MNDFLKLVLYLLRAGIGRAAAAAALCACLIGVFYIRHRKHYGKEQPFPWRRVILCLLSVGYLSILMYVTVFRYIAGASGFNFHLFRAWREAWNNFSVTALLNPILNIAMFFPFGILLPLLWKRFRKWPAMLAAALAFSLFLESSQYLKRCGIFDVDDLFANTLGAMLGYCGLMAVMTIFGKQKAGKLRRFLSYSALPILAAGTLCGAIACYLWQPYGNLSGAPSYRLNTKHIQWELECQLEDAGTEVSVFQTATLNRAACDAFGADFAQRIGVTFERVDYYDQSTWFMKQKGPGYAHFLIVSLLDGSYEYSGGSDAQPAQADEATLRAALQTFGIEIPQSAQFACEGDGWHSFSVEREIVGSSMTDGVIRCRYREDGTISNIENSMVTYTVCGQASILSSAEAYAALCRGDFTSTLGFETYASDTVRVLSCTLDYQVDTKGCYQPAYRFALVSGDYQELVMIPALKG